MRRPPSCPFCRVADGHVPVDLVYADDLVLAFLETAPINPGHTILIPRQHAGGLSGLPPELLAHMMGLAPWLAQTIVRAMDADGYNLHASSGGCAGQDILHACVHLIPRFGTDGFYFGWRSQPYAHPDAAEQVAAKIREKVDHRQRVAATGEADADDAEDAADVEDPEGADDAAEDGEGETNSTDADADSARANGDNMQSGGGGYG